MNIQFLKLNENAKIPSRATSKSSGLDLYALNESIIKSKSMQIINTGIACIIPNGYEGQIRSRSGLASKNSIFVLNSPGTIDNDYRGELKVILYNSYGLIDTSTHKYSLVKEYDYSPSVLKIHLKCKCSGVLCKIKLIYQPLYHDGKYDEHKLELREYFVL